MTSMFEQGASGHDLVTAIEMAARTRGMSPTDFARPLSTLPDKWLKQTRAALKPKTHTIERVNALLADQPVPPAPANNFQRGTRSTSLHAVFSPRDPPVPNAPRMDREPCWRCGVRGDVGCVHRVARWGDAA